MRINTTQTGTRIFGAFAVVFACIVLITGVALWRMQAGDAATRELVEHRLAAQRLGAELLAVTRLNGTRTVAIARSDSLEVGDFFQAQLDEGEREAAGLEAAIAELAATPAERALASEAATRKSAWLAMRQQVFQAKDMGRTQDVERLAGAGLADAFAAYAKALDAQLAYQTGQARARMAASERMSTLSRALLLAAAGAALLLGGLAGWLLQRSIVAPLKQAVALAERVAEGDLGATIVHARGDEIGRLFDALNHMTGGVSSTVARVLGSARLIDDASADIAAGNRELAARTERQADHVQVTVAAMAALLENVQQNHVSAHDASELALSASSVAQQGAGAVGQMVERMETIRMSAAKIGDITAMIDGIAFQTNILALNAAVEAARAGSEGRGFAVVANEVRSLAQHSAAAAKEIKTLIGASLEAIESGAGIAGAAGATMEQILARVRQVAELMKAIDAASSEQAGAIERVRSTVAGMDEATRSNAALVEQAATAADTMRAQAGALTAVVGTFRIAANQPGIAGSDGGQRTRQVGALVLDVLDADR